MAVASCLSTVLWSAPTTWFETGTYRFGILSWYRGLEEAVGLGGSRQPPTESLWTVEGAENITQDVMVQGP
jgi:hypothetical protein